MAVAGWTNTQCRCVFSIKRKKNHLPHTVHVHSARTQKQVFFCISIFHHVTERVAQVEEMHIVVMENVDQKRTAKERLEAEQQQLLEEEHRRKIKWQVLLGAIFTCGRNDGETGALS